MVTHNNNNQSFLTKTKTTGSQTKLTNRLLSKTTPLQGHKQKRQTSLLCFSQNGTLGRVTSKNVICLFTKTLQAGPETNSTDRLLQNTTIAFELRKVLLNVSNRISTIELPKQMPTRKPHQTSNTPEIIPQIGTSSTEQLNCFIVFASFYDDYASVHYLIFTCSAEVMKLAAR